MKNIKITPILLLIYLSTGCSKNQPADSSEKEPSKLEEVEFTDNQLKNLDILTDTMHILVMEENLQLNGKIELPPKSSYTIGAPLGGTISSIEVMEGKFVTKGMPLLILEDEKFIMLQQEFIHAKNEVQIKQKEFNRQKELYAQKAATEKALDMAQIELLNQQTALSASTEKLKLIGLNPATVQTGNISRRIPVPAPVSGYVSKVHLNSGSYALPVSVIAEMIDLNAMILKITVFEKDLYKIETGLPFEAFPNHNPTQKHYGLIEAISPVLDRDNSFHVFGKFSKIDATMKPGTFLNTRITLKKQNKYVLPVEAVIQSEGKEYVFVNKSGKYALKEVKTGLSQMGKTEIVSGLIPGERVITRGAFNAFMVLRND